MFIQSSPLTCAVHKFIYLKCWLAAGSQSYLKHALLHALAISAQGNICAELLWPLLCLQGGHSAVSQATLTRIMSAAVADAVVGLVGATFGDDQEDAQSGIYCKP